MSRIALNKDTYWKPNFNREYIAILSFSVQGNSYFSYSGRCVQFIVRFRFHLVAGHTHRTKSNQHRAVWERIAQ